MFNKEKKVQECDATMILPRNTDGLKIKSLLVRTADSYIATTAIFSSLLLDLGPRTFRTGIGAGINRRH
jgi:hypothetical protein